MQTSLQHVYQRKRYLLIWWVLMRCGLDVLQKPIMFNFWNYETRFKMGKPSSINDGNETCSHVDTTKRVLIKIWKLLSISAIHNHILLLSAVIITQCRLFTWKKEREKKYTINNNLNACETKLVPHTRSNRLYNVI